MRNVDILRLIMCFCLPLTVVSLPQCTHDYWAVQCERKRKMKRWGGWEGWEGVSCWKKPVDLSAGIFSPPPPPLNETHNKASSVCVVSSSIHVPRGKHSPSFSNSPPSTPSSVSPCLTSSFSLKPLENCCSQRSPPSRSGSVNIFNSACLGVCVCACLISLSS